MSEESRVWLGPDGDLLLERFLKLSSNLKQRDEEFQPVKNVALLLNLHESRIRQMVDEGLLPSIKIFGRIYIHTPTLLMMLKDQAA